jgi:hypothetical protein
MHITEAQKATAQLMASDLQARMREASAQGKPITASQAAGDLGINATRLPITPEALVKARQAQKEKERPQGRPRPAATPARATRSTSGPRPESQQRRPIDLTMQWGNSRY